MSRFGSNASDAVVAPASATLLSPLMRTCATEGHHRPDNMAAPMMVDDLAVATNIGSRCTGHTRRGVLSLCKLQPASDAKKALKR